MAYHPEVQRRVVETRIEAMGAILDRTVTDWATGVDHGHDSGEAVARASIPTSRPAGADR